MEDSIILFGPKNGKSLLRAHPELSENPVFKSLPGDELLFAWYIGIPNSPIDNEWTEKVRFTHAAHKCFSKNKEKQEQFSSGLIPDEVKAAIEAFKKFNPEARNEALKMTQTIFNKYKQMVDVDVKADFVETDKDGNTSINFTARKQYIDSMAKIREELPLLIKQIEEGYGVTENKKIEEKKLGIKPIDKYHQNKNV